MARMTSLQSEQAEGSASASMSAHYCKTKDSAHFVGVDVGTNSARACIINDDGVILGYAAEDIRQW
jgi:activator of 2-hydroxyglutaryl-CoA dehydratase